MEYANRLQAALPFYSEGQREVATVDNIMTVPDRINSHTWYDAKLSREPGTLCVPVRNLWVLLL